MDKEVASLRARLEALEAKAVPYTEQELGLFSRLEVNLATTTPPSPDGSAPQPAAPPASAPSTPQPAPQSLDLVNDARKDFNAGNFAEAEKKFTEALKQDEKNVYTLAHLAATELELQKLPEAEVAAQKALAVAPDDAAALYMLGIIRLRQEKIDDAVDALSRSARANGQNPATQNSLGVALSQKGLREPAETAFRKALQIRPDYADAHYNLAVEYILQQPPSFKLAQWHYQKAIAYGHGKNAELEKRLEAAAAAGAPKAPGQ
ncbi:MAG TPA: hypothetical protein DCM86_18675 [Verrucomicrobiales bacterium]|nr:hypothetical protein [Verrucomicrobiales bacterium]